MVVVPTPPFPPATTIRRGRRAMPGGPGAAHWRTSWRRSLAWSGMGREEGLGIWDFRFEISDLRYVKHYSLSIEHWSIGTFPASRHGLVLRSPSIPRIRRAKRRASATSMSSGTFWPLVR